MKLSISSVPLLMIIVAVQARIGTIQQDEPNQTTTAVDRDLQFIVASRSSPRICSTDQSLEYQVNPRTVPCIANSQCRPTYTDEINEQVSGGCCLWPQCVCGVPNDFNDCSTQDTVPLDRSEDVDTLPPYEGHGFTRGQFALGTEVRPLVDVSTRTGPVDQDVLVPEGGVGDRSEEDVDDGGCSARVDAECDSNQACRDNPAFPGRVCCYRFLCSCEAIVPELSQYCMSD